MEQAGAAADRMEVAEGDRAGVDRIRAEAAPEPRARAEPAPVVAEADRTIKARSPAALPSLSGDC